MFLFLELLIFKELHEMSNEIYLTNLNVNNASLLECLTL